MDALLSPGQVTFFVAYGWTLCLWLLSEYLNRVKPRTSAGDYDAVASDVEGAKKDDTPLHPPSSAPADANGHAPSSNGHAALTSPSKPPPASSKASSSLTSILLDSGSSGLIRCMLFDMEAIKREHAVLKAMAEFGSLLVWYFLCDRTPLIGEADKAYSRDLLAFLFLVLTAVAFGSSLQVMKVPVLLNRQQTEEWKGWMQVLFLLYHYYEAREIYNAIRLFIAAYVWMTGFGNFSYYYKTGDYCIGRFAQMMWRLNFLVFFTCLVLRNSYMLYYICPMHTIFTVLVYACLGLAPHLNQYNALLALKMLACVGLVVLCWDVKPVFNALWSPFTWLVGYTDPRKPSADVLHEWFFRSSLDRFIWIYGMLCAWMHPHAAAALTYIDALPTARRLAARAALLSSCLVAGYFWYVHVYCLPKLQYNELHPYTSWIPITLFIVLRNLTPPLRLHHLRLYGWLGCITLETYLGQFHIWLKTGIPDGQPKALLSLLPGYPLMNFALVTAGYVFVSFRLFNLTNDLKNAVVPHSNNALLLRNVLLMAAGGSGLYALCYGATAALRAVA